MISTCLCSPARECEREEGSALEAAVLELWKEEAVLELWKEEAVLELWKEEAAWAFWKKTAALGLWKQAAVFLSIPCWQREPAI